MREENSNIKKSLREYALENISKDELKRYYINHTREDTCNHFNITTSTLQWLLKYYKIKKTKEQKRDTIQNKYDGDFYSIRNKKSYNTKIKKYGSIEQFEKLKEEKRKDSLISKYGSMENYIQHMTESYKNTCQEIYGVDNVSQLDFVKKQKQESLIEHFGSLENAYKERQLKSNETLINKYGSLEDYRKFQQELSRQTYMEKYGVNNPFQSEEVKEKIRETNLKKYGVEYSCMLDVCRSNGKNNSKPNLDFQKLLEDNQMTIDKKEFVLGKYIYDFKVGKLLFEINPYATHNSTWSPFGNHEGISKYYHKLKSENAFKFGYRCIHIFDWDNRNDIIKNIKDNKYLINNQIFKEPRLYIYNIKEKRLTDKMSENCVEIYDDGIIVNIDDGDDLL